MFDILSFRGIVPRGTQCAYRPYYLHACMPRKGVHKPKGT